MVTTRRISLQPQDSTVKARCFIGATIRAGAPAPYQNTVTLCDRVQAFNKAWGAHRTVTGQAETLDLTALVDPEYGEEGHIVNMTGRRLRAIRVYLTTNGVANADGIVIKAGTLNGYELFGSSGQVPVLVGGSCTFWLEDTPMISSTAKTLFIGTEATPVGGDTFTYGIILIAV